MKLDKTITYKEAKSIRDTYVAKDQNKEKTQQVFFKYELLMDYLHLIAKGHTPEEVKKMGVKIYFGQYPDDYPEQHRRGRLTLMLVPTLEHEESERVVNQDIITVSKDGQEKLLQVIEAFNHGELCPPYPVDGSPVCEGSAF